MRSLKAISIGMVLICHVFLGKPLSGGPIDFETFYDQQLDSSNYDDFEDFVRSALPVLDYALEGLGLALEDQDNQKGDPLEIARQKWKRILVFLSDGKSVKGVNLALEHLDNCLSDGLLPLPTLKDATSTKKSFFQFATLSSYFPRGFVPVYIPSNSIENIASLNAHPLSFSLIDNRFSMVKHDLLHAIFMAYPFQAFGLADIQSHVEWMDFFNAAKSASAYKRIALFFLFHEQTSYYIGDTRLPSILGQGVDGIEGAGLFEFVLEIAISKAKYDPFYKILHGDQLQHHSVCAWVDSVFAVEKEQYARRLRQTKLASVVPSDVQSIFVEPGKESDFKLYFEDSVDKLKAMCRAVPMQRVWKRSKSTQLTDEEMVKLYRGAFHDEFWSVVKDVGKNLKEAIEAVRKEFPKGLAYYFLKNLELSAPEAD